jgi:hypothetical protein
MSNRIFSHVASSHFSLSIIGFMIFLSFVLPYHPLPTPSFYAEWIAAVIGIVALIPLLKFKNWQSVSMSHISLIFAGLIAIVIIPWLLGMLHSAQYALLIILYLVWASLLAVLGGHLSKELGWEKIVTTMSWAVLAGGLFNVLLIVLQYINNFAVESAWLPNFDGYSAMGQVNHFVLATVSLIYLYAKGQFNLKVLLVSLIIFLAMLELSGLHKIWLYLSVLTLLAISLQVAAIKQRTGSKSIRSTVRIALLLLPTFFILKEIMTWLLSGQLIYTPVHQVNVSGLMQLEGASILLLLLAGLALWMHTYKLHRFNLEAWFFVAVFSTLLMDSILNFPLLVSPLLGLIGFFLGALQRK